MKPPLLTRNALAALLILLTVAAYVPAIGAGYIWDDDTLLTANPQMRSVAGLAEIWSGAASRDYTPLTLSIFWLEWRFWGGNPAGFHGVNILLHGLCALLLWRILERLRVPGAWLGAVLFAIHPVNVASVAWVAELKNTLSAAFFLGSILCYLAWRDEKGRLLYAGSIALFLLAALSKGSVVMLPAVLILCVLWRERRVAWRDLVQILPHAAIALAAALLTIRFQARAQHYGLIPDSLDYRVARAGAAIWLYLGALLWPGGMSPIRPPWLPDLRSPVTYLPALAAAGALGLLYWKRRGWGRPLLFAYGYFLIMLAPVLGFVWMTLMQETPAADWWQYMAAPGIFACAAAGCDAALRGWRAAMPVLCVAVCLLLVQTWRRAAIYESMESYCRAVTAEDPAAWTLENNLGIVLKRRGRFAEAEACYRRALEANPGYVEARLNLGNALCAAGDLDGAEGEFQAAARLRPGDSHALAGLASLGGLYAGRGRYAEAAGALREALKMDTGSIPLRIELCEALAAQGDKEGALRVCTEVEQLAARSGDPAAIDAAARLRKDCEGGRE